MIHRKPFEGIINIIRFNWHYYLLALIFTVLFFLLFILLPGFPKIAAGLLCFAVLITAVISLVVSWYVYDVSHLYKLTWLPKTEGTSLINIHAGFDEVSALLQSKYPHAKMKVFDFFDVQKHTEISIRRARKSSPQFMGTQTITTNNVPAEDESTDIIFAFLAAHEIRDPLERINFFTELRRVLKPTGRIIVTEHLRDLPNLLAYNIGFLHFHSKKSWLHTFTSAGLEIQQQIKITPFITTFILQSNGTAA